MATKKTGKPVGRPTLFATELAEAICDLIASGAFMRDIYAMPGMPCKSTFERWRAQHPSFGAEYVRARALSAEVCEWAVASLVKAVEAGEIEPKAAAVAFKAQIWLAKVRDPATYGDKQAVELSDDNTGLSVDELKAKARVLARHLLEANGGNGEESKG